MPKAVYALLFFGSAFLVATAFYLYVVPIIDEHRVQWADWVDALPGRMRLWIKKVTQ